MGCVQASFAQGELRGKNQDGDTNKGACNWGGWDVQERTKRRGTKDGFILAAGGGGEAGTFVFLQTLEKKKSCWYWFGGGWLLRLGVLCQRNGEAGKMLGVGNIFGKQGNGDEILLS